VSTENRAGVRRAIVAFFGPHALVRPTDDGYRVEALVGGDTAKEVNRAFLSSARRVEKRTRVRAEWTCGTTTERFFD